MRFSHLLGAFPLTLLLGCSLVSANITATSSSDDGHVAENTLDGSLAGWSRWSSKGDWEWIQYDLGEPQQLLAVEIAFHRGDQRQAYFDLQSSTDGVQWEPLIEDTSSSGSTRDFETIDVPDTTARYVRYVGWGNSNNLWNSITEIRFVTETDVDPLPPVGDWWQPAQGLTWQWQLTGTINTGYDAQMYGIDLFDSDITLIESLQQSGRRVLCYFSAGSYEDWRTDGHLFTSSDLGDPMGDWEGENWLDIRSANVRDIMRARMVLAQTKGCDGVEPDNVDGYANSTGLPLTYADQISYNRFLADTAHELGLAVALKNDLGQVEDLVTYFDLAINESCHKYNECFLLQPFITQNKPVLNAEYASKYVNDPTARETLCNASKAFGMHTLVLPRNLHDGFRLDCGM
tara:strand:- start:7971 stop:9179 length:1209 start_codon:yes stop_codon:yes gene_type:complete